ncbi:hypothetical protein J6590_008012 [Homalodisca vitripennis]|nr:hypothetical protein J6590_008012 [Homalodisca vitripennis]
MLDNFLFPKVEESGEENDIEVFWFNRMVPRLIPPVIHAKFCKFPGRLISLTLEVFDFLNDLIDAPLVKSHGSLIHSHLHSHQTILPLPHQNQRIDGVSFEFRPSGSP